MNQICFDCGRESPMPESGGRPVCPHCGSSFVTPLADQNAPASPHRDALRRSLQGGAPVPEGWPEADGGASPAEGLGVSPPEDDPFTESPGESEVPTLPDAPASSARLPPARATASGRPVLPGALPRTSVRAPVPVLEEAPDNTLRDVIVAPAIGAVLVFLLGIGVTTRLSVPDVVVPVSTPTASTADAPPIPALPGTAKTANPVRRVAPTLRPKSRKASDIQVLFRTEAQTTYSNEPVRYAVYVRNLGVTPVFVTLKSISMTYACIGVQEQAPVDESVHLASTKVSPSAESLLVRVERRQDEWDCGAGAVVTDELQMVVATTSLEDDYEFAQYEKDVTWRVGYTVY